MGIDLRQCVLMATLQCCPMGRSCRQHHDLIILLSRINSETERILIMTSAWLGSNNYQSLSHWFTSTKDRTHRFESHDHPKWETSAHLIQSYPMYTCILYIYTYVRAFIYYSINKYIYTLTPMFFSFNVVLL